MDKNVQLFTVVKCGDGYETFDEVLGYADNEASAQQMLEQAKIFNPHGKYRIEPIRFINFLFREP